MNNDSVKVIVTYPNQKVIITNKAQSDKENIYGIQNLKALYQAAKSLTNKAFKLYIYMNCNQAGYKYALSPKAVCIDIGLKEKSCQSAVKELVEKGYLVKQNDGSNIYDFYELPPESDSVNLREQGNIQESGRREVHNGVYIYPKELNNTPASGREIVHDTTNNITDNTSNNKETTNDSNDNSWIDIGWAKVKAAQPEYKKSYLSNVRTKDDLPF